ncbi:hypothetical protein GPAL_1381 [Glaciecola pallidula DSM 14239 = ACAM 615]|uniref:Uncharacterized protein n=1 Tax=Brumicola pallidula DSM 14239 = ACAM 615 TaxID=1121922 RepID=K6Y646_9ALTE|nr:hypothetical protein GPAL_1381 [Glaciecola pallidula DSM 14239 = ACAM 615]
MNTQQLTQPLEGIDIDTRYTFAALIADGCAQLWIEKQFIHEQDFRDYLNFHYPFYICLYCKEC